jgi:5,6,7,8-tetrahydromethanopterin hydro-lyase
MLIGESFVGEGADAVHVSTVLGRRDGPAGVAWAAGRPTPRPGDGAFAGARP